MSSSHCKCKRYPNQERSVQMTSKSDKTLHFSNQSIQVSVFEGYSRIELEQHFLNEFSETLDVQYHIPTDPDHVISALTIRVDDVLVEGVVKSLSSAKNEYRKETEQGNLAVLLEESEDDKDLLKVSVGNVLPKAKVVVHLKILTLLQIEAGAYCVRVPTCYVTKYNSIKDQPRKENAKMKVEKESKKSNYEYRFEIRSQKHITYLSVPTNCTVIRNEVQKDLSLVQIQSTPRLASLSKDLLLYFKTEGMHQPKLFAQHNKNEVALMFSMVPTFRQNEPQEDPIIVEDETPEDEELPDGSNDIYIFLVDRSGSMDGENIEMTIKALIYFLKSLPKSCHFEIISFGSEYQLLSKGKGFEYTEQNVKDCIIKIQKFKADFAGTEIFDPLHHALVNLKTNRNKKIFVLTDGEICDPQSVIKLAKQHSDQSKVHTFGIGNGCSKYLVKNLALAGRGSYSILENNNVIVQNVIAALKKATGEQLKECKVKLKGIDPILQVPEKGFTSDLFKDSLFTYFGIVSKKDFKDLEATFSCKMNPTTKMPLKFLCKQWMELESGNDLFQLSARAMAKQLLEKDEIEIYGYKKIEGFKKETERIALKYQVLTKLTAFIGIIKQANDKRKINQKAWIPLVQANNMSGSSVSANNRSRSTTSTFSQGALPQNAKFKCPSGPMHQLKRKTILKPKRSVSRSRSRDPPIRERRSMSSNEESDSSSDSEEEEKMIKVKSKPELSLQNLISLQQSVEGSWTNSSGVFPFFKRGQNFETMKNELIKLVSKSVLDKVWLTLLVLYILDQKFHSQMSEWKMIKQKAVGFLKQCKMGGYQAFLKRFNFALA